MSKLDGKYLGQPIYRCGNPAAGDDRIVSKDCDGVGPWLRIDYDGEELVGAASNNLGVYRTDEVVLAKEVDKALFVGGLYETPSNILFPRKVLLTSECESKTFPFRGVVVYDNGTVIPSTFGPDCGLVLIEDMSGSFDTKQNYGVTL